MKKTIIAALLASSTLTPSFAQKPPSAPSKDRKIDDKKKKGMDSYKRQAFTRVFDQRGAMSRADTISPPVRNILTSPELYRPKS